MMMVQSGIDIKSCDMDTKKHGTIEVLFLSDFIVPEHPLWDELKTAGFELHSSKDKDIPSLTKGKAIVVVDAIADSIPDRWFYFLVENERLISDIPKILLVMKDETLVHEKKELFQCDAVLEVATYDFDSISRFANSLRSLIHYESKPRLEITGWQELSERLLDKIYQYRTRVDVFHKIVGLAPSIKEYDFTLNSILKQVNKVFNVPISSLYVKQDNGVYTLVTEPISKKTLKNHIQEFVRSVNAMGISTEGLFEITWGRNIVIGDYSSEYSSPSQFVFPLEAKGDTVGFWAIPSSDEKCFLDEMFLSMISQQITLLINYSWLYKKQGVTVRSNLHRLSAINEVCKFFGNIDVQDFGLQFLLILLEHISADKGLLILLDGDGKIKENYHIGFAREQIDEILNGKDKLPYEKAHENNEVVIGSLTIPAFEDCEKTDYHYVGIPLVGVRGNMGVVFIFFRILPSGEEDFLAFFKTMAILAGTHFESIDLYHQYMEKRIMEEQINIARQIQRELLPKSTPVMKHFQISAESKSATQVGGDFYDFIEIAPNKRAIIIGDVSGKGIPASQLMAMTKSLLKFNLERTGNLRDTMFEVNNYLATETPSEKFVTVQAIIVDEKAKKIEIVNAGHGTLLAYRWQKKAFENIKMSGLPLGIDTDIAFDVYETDYNQNDIFLMYTDGLSESMSPRKALFGEKKILTLLEENVGCDTDEILNKFFAELENHAEGGAQHDDTTIIVLKAK